MSRWCFIRVRSGLPFVALLLLLLWEVEQWNCSDQLVEAEVVVAGQSSSGEDVERRVACYCFSIA